MGLPGQARLAAARPAGAGQPSAGEELAARLRALAADTVAPEEALEPALRATLEEVGVAAGALCVFDPRHERLWLAGEVGLSDEGCRQLRNVRRGTTLTWDMPLHGLLNRRAYLIDSAARNRYVPPLVEPVTSMRTIACLPLYADVTPVGSLILIAIAPQILREQDIRNLTQPTRELVAMIEAVRKRASATQSDGNASAAGSPGSRTAAPAARAGGATPTLAARRSDPEDVARLQALTVAVARAEQERDRLATQLEASAAEHAAMTRTQAALEARLIEATTELEWTRLRLADADAAAARAHERACDAERERERAGVALDAATARERALQSELEAAPARTTATTDTAGAGDQAGEARTTTQAAVAALEEELARAQAEIARLTRAGTHDEAEAELAALRQECAALRASAAATAREQDEITRQELDRARAQLERELEEARTREAHTATRLTQLEGEVGTVREERAALAANLETLAADRDRLRDALAALEAEKAASGPLIPALEEAGLALEPCAADDVPAVETAPPQAATGSAPAASAAHRPLLVVIDGDPAWEHVGGEGSVTQVAPADAVARVAELQPGHLVVNLASPGGFTALIELRAAGVTAPLLACLADPAANRAIPLGRVEPARRPLDPDGVLAALGDTVGRGTKMVTVGTDVDALMSLRQIFTRQGLSVSMAWDVKQATDLLGMIRPALVVVDLEQPPRVGAGIVARLAGADPIPTTVLISSGEKDPAPAFRTALADAAHNHRTVTLGRALELMRSRTGT